jgi:hypothetical protein
MAKSFEVDMNGLLALERRVNSISQNLRNKVIIEAQAEMQIAANEAKKNAPVDTGGAGIRGSINPFFEKSQTSSIIGVVAQKDYAAYWDFGTIEYVNVPSGLENIAIQFKGRGIRNVGGIKPKPYLYPAFFRAVERLKSRLKQIIFDK